MKATFILFLFVLLSACSGSGKRQFSSLAEARDYANDNRNGYISSTESGDHIFSARVNPVLQGDDVVGINLRIARADGKSVLGHGESSPEDIAAHEMYLSFDFLQDVYLNVDGKEVKPLLHHYEHTYQLKPGVDILLTFPLIHPQSTVQLLIRDHLFGEGLQELTFDPQVFGTITIQ